MSQKQLNLFDFDDDFSIQLLIKEKILASESYQIEYKSGRNGFPNEIWKSYSAFANTNTGVIVVGVKDKNGSLTIEGLTDEQIQDYQKIFWDNCNNPNTISKNLLTNDDVRVLAFKEKKLLLFKIPYAKRTERPVHLTRNPLGNTYKRNHEGDYRCTDDEVKRMLADSATELCRDNLILENFTIEDLDPVSIRQFRQLFAATNSSHPWLILEDIELLKKLGAIRVDRRTRQEGITLAGLLMFGKSDSIAEQVALPNYFPDFRECLSTEKNIRWTNRIYPDGTWECNLLQFYLKVWPKLSSTLPKPFRLENDERIDETPAHTALREAFVNTLVHTDYSLSGNIIIELDTEKFVFSNPGTLLVSLEQYYAGGISECRNPSLQRMFMLIGRAEKAGSGVDKIMTGWSESHWRRPYLELTNQPDRVILTMPMFSVIPQNILNELFVKFESVEHRSADELTALAICFIEGSISNHRLQYVLNLHSAEITTMLRKLCDDGYLESDNNGRWSIYKLREKVASSEKLATSLKPTEYQTDTHVKVATSNAKVATFVEGADNHGYKHERVASSRKKVASSLSKNRKRAELEAFILSLCKGAYITKEEIADRVNRSENYIRNKILPKLLKEGKLQKKYPYTHNHPRQAYITNDDYGDEI